MHRDVGYATVDGLELRLDLYLPDVRPAPLCIWLHGGGWLRGSRSDRADARLLPLAATGVAVAAVQYRLSGQAPFPAPLEDARAAVRWLRAHAGDHGLDATRIGAWGASAGGHLAALLALTDDPAGDNSSVQAVVSWFAPSDLLLRDSDVPEGPLPPFVTGPLPEPSFEARLLGVEDVRQDADAARAASPVAHVRPGAPPFLLMHGDRDGLIPSAHSRALHRALRAEGVDSTLWLLSGANHEDPAFDFPASLAAVSAFLRTHLLP
ncbi:alpha/beta hydrolase [Blastococcus xanthinilyticus]|uniref:Acetyl esterase/lipase n=1 Tax=Blastococcus xanthinilyticus TaxID=1564164 RepID=A0A5S5D0Y3_9ACTN|nr:alpha/beta hydrolase [Blastococcus xanthinilyticus]TYP89004.1 acetyl esterase/lipase [Blastococcus xanthinilyticus]